jgi:hypothetical protein
LAASATPYSSRTKHEYTKIAAIQGDQLGPRHRHTLTTRHLLAVVLLALGDLNAAENDTRFVLAARSELLGKEHPTTLITLSQMALVHLRRGRVAEAVREYRVVLALQIRHLGSDHPNTKITRQRLAEALLRRAEGAPHSPTARRTNIIPVSR